VLVLVLEYRMARGECHMDILWKGYHYDTMSVTTIHQNAATIESSHELLC
jgi:hypothetical protein